MATIRDSHRREMNKWRVKTLWSRSIMAPQEALWHFRMAQIQADDLEELKAAVESYRAGLRLDSEDFASHVRLAALLQRDDTVDAFVDDNNDEDATRLDFLSEAKTPNPDITLTLTPTSSLG